MEAVVAENKILKKMLDRLFAALINGPSLNCRPHNSRQRIDLVQLGKLKDQTPEEIPRSLLGPDREAKIADAMIDPAIPPLPADADLPAMAAARGPHAAVFCSVFTCGLREKTRTQLRPLCLAL
jgi:hypothetical protein